MSEIIDVSQAILEKIDEIEKLKKTHKDIIDRASEAMSSYDRELALTIVRLRNGVAIPIGDEIVKDPPALLIERLAKGIVWEKKLESDRLQGYLSGIKSNLMATQAQLNGLQSINRHLSDI